jgi:hypothetical protein
VFSRRAQRRAGDTRGQRRSGLFPNEGAGQAGCRREEQDDQKRAAFTAARSSGLNPKGPITDERQGRGAKRLAAGAIRLQLLGRVLK